MFDFSSLDQNLRVIPSKEWRSYCGSFAKERGGRDVSSLGVSSEMWAKYRIESEILPRQRYFTQHEAIRIFVRSNWRKACSESGAEYKRVTESHDLIRVGKIWFSKMPRSQVKQIDQVIMGSCIDGKTFLNHLEDFIGKKVTERTLRRICQASPKVPSFRRKAFYTIDQIRKMIQATIDYYETSLDDSAIG